MWTGEHESAAFGLSVLIDLKAGGVEDILIACTDNLKGFTDAIKNVFPQTIMQLFIVHQYATSADMWYGKRAGARKFRFQGEEKYKYAIQCWQNNWENLTYYFDFPIEIRKIIYTTNTIENLNRGICKYTKTKTQFIDVNAALKLFISPLPTLKRMELAYPKLGLVLHQFLTILIKDVNFNHMLLIGIYTRYVRVSKNTRSNFQRRFNKTCNVYSKIYFG